MDVARLGALAALALACRGAEAQRPPDDGAASAAPPLAADEPGHGIDVPHDWRELPAIADAAVAASRATLDADVHAHAWGEPSRGCYLAVVAIDGRVADTTAAVVRELEAALRGGLDLGEWTTSADAEDRAEVAATFTRGGMTGELRAHVVRDGRRIPHVIGAACFYNDRQPSVCDHACTPLLAMLASPEPPTP